MEKMPYREELDMRVGPAFDESVVSTDRRSGLPALAGRMVTLRDLRASDAAPYRAAESGTRVDSLRESSSGSSGPKSANFVLRQVISSQISEPQRG